MTGSVGPDAAGRPTANGIAVLVLVVAVTSVYALPQILYFVDGRRDAVILALDEAPYVARVQEVMNGHWRPVDQYLWESKHNQFLLPYGAELAIGLPARLLRVNIDTTMIAVRFVAPALLTLALYRLFSLLTSSVRWSVFGVALVMLEPGSYFYQPFHYLTSWLGTPSREHLTLLYTRFHNPLVLALPFVLAAAAVYEALEAEEVRRRSIAGFRQKTPKLSF